MSTANISNIIGSLDKACVDSDVDDRYQKWLFTLLKKIDKGRLRIIYQGKYYDFGRDDTDKIQAEITVTDRSVFKHVVLNSVVGVGEMYMLGLWETPDLTKIIQVFSRNLPLLKTMDQNTSLTQKMVLSWLRFINKNTLSQAKKNIKAHYDLGNDFFNLFLDPTMMYSSAIFSSDEDTLHQASLNKLEAVCQKLQLKPTDHLLEIGTGWGGMAIYAAKHYGCQVTTTTISPSQYEYACKRVIEENLQDKVTVLLEDYRDLQGSYSKLVSIEMIEAVGHDYYPLYFSNCSRLLKDDGIAVIQAITIPDQRYDNARRSVDFIQKYIFPGGSLPSNQVISNQVAYNTNMQISDMHDITSDYATTLERWRENFNQKIEQVKQQGFDEQFIRMWQFYFCYCEGGFRERIINTFQYVLVKPQTNYKLTPR